jgi:predicted DNA-binding protein
MSEKSKTKTKRYSVNFDERFARRLDAIAHFKGLSTTQYIRMIIMDHVYNDLVSVPKEVDKK